MEETKTAEQQARDMAAKYTEQRIQDLQRQIQTSEEKHAVELDRLNEQWAVRFKAAETVADERGAELKAQADGVLGTLGRVMVERDQALEKIKNVEHEANDQRTEVMAKLFEVRNEMDKLRHENETLRKAAASMKAPKKKR
jgi:hypothetical protein